MKKRKPSAPAIDSGDGGEVKSKRAVAKARTIVELVPRAMRAAEKKQWDCVRAWRRWLDGHGTSDLPNQISSLDDRLGVGDLDRARMMRLQTFWQACRREFVYPGAFSRDADEGLGVPPLHALFLWISFGLYPPPELLLTLADVFKRYMDKGGPPKALEEAFFGMPIRGAGTYARQTKSRSRELGIILDVFMQMKLAESKGIKTNRTKAAAEILKQRGSNRSAKEQVKEIRRHVRPVGQKGGK